MKIIECILQICLVDQTAHQFMEKQPYGRNLEQFLIHCV